MLVFLSKNQVYKDFIGLKLILFVLSLYNSFYFNYISYIFSLNDQKFEFFNTGKTNTNILTLKCLSFPGSPECCTCSTKSPPYKDYNHGLTKQLQLLPYSCHACAKVGFSCHMTHFNYAFVIQKNNADI